MSGCVRIGEGREAEILEVGDGVLPQLRAYNQRRTLVR
jgi:hypothetical protein